MMSPPSPSAESPLPGRNTFDQLVPALQAMTTSSTLTTSSPVRKSENDSVAPAVKTPLADTFPAHSPSLQQSASAASDTNEASPMGQVTTNLSVQGRRPSTPRAQTDPSPSFADLLPTHHPRPRNRSPYSRSHLRSSSASASPSAPPMMRAHSLPTVINPAAHLALSPSPMPGRSSSPLRSPKRNRSPRIQPSLYDESYAHSGAPSVCDISEDAELELTPKAGPLQPSPLSMYSSTGSLSRRRRPASPLYNVAFGAAVSAPAVRTPTSGSSSPLLSATKFNEPFPNMNANYPSSHASSSVPSTPTSMRSRSPSISSLETIPDTPDAEAEAIEADRVAREKAAAEQEQEGTEGARRSSLDVPGGSGRVLGFGKRDSRKRWSVCGAERRGDLDLETIWED
jgi:hypothetical protein